LVAKTPKGRKQKGKNFEIIVADAIREAIQRVIPIQDSEVMQVYGSGRGMDIKLSKRVAGWFPFGCECKNHDNLDFCKAWGQCAYNAEKEGLTPLLMFKYPRTEPYVAMRLSDFLRIYTLLLKLSMRKDEKK
jgi:hypothetical protein